MAGITAAGYSVETLLRREAAARADASAERLRRQAAEAADAQARPQKSALARAARENAGDLQRPEVLDFREHEPELLRYRRARDARDAAWARQAARDAFEAAIEDGGDGADAGASRASTRYPADAQTARYRVEVESAASASREYARAPASDEGPVVASATAVRSTQSAARAYAALASEAAPTSLSSAAEDARSYQALKEASLRLHASNAYRAVDLPADYPSVSRFA